MATTLETSSELKAWDSYRSFMKERLKQLPDGENEFFLSKEKFEFDQDGKPWKGYAVLAGPKGARAVKQLKKEGMLFREGTCLLHGKVFTVDGIAPALLKHGRVTLKRLKIGYTIGGATDPVDELEDGFSPVLEKQLEKLLADIEKAARAHDATAKPFLDQASQSASEARDYLGQSELKPAEEALKKGAEFLKQAQLATLEGGEDTEAAVIEKRRQELVAELKEAVALREPANDTTLKHALHKAKTTLDHVGKKDYAAATKLLDEIEDHLADIVEGPEPAAGADPDLAGLSDWKAYREFMKVQLKKLGREEGPIFVSRKKVEFDIDGKPFKGFAVLVGKKARITVNILKKAGTLFKEGLVRADGKKLLVSSVQAELIKGAKKTFLKLRLGRKIVPHGELPPDEGENAEDATDDPTGSRRLDREIKSVAAKLVELRTSIDGQKKFSTQQSKETTDLEKEAEKRKVKLKNLVDSGEGADNVADARERYTKKRTEAMNRGIESKELGVLTKRWTEELREFTEKLHRIKDSSDSNDEKRAAVKKLKDDVARKLLDTKIASLSTADPGAGRLIAKQIKARFGTKFRLYESEITGKDKDGRPIVKDNAKRRDPKKEAEALKALYLTLSKCPNFPKTSLKVIEVSLVPKEARGEGGVYYTREKKAAINCKRPKDSLSYDFGNAKHFPEGVDPDCQPANKEPVKYFNWATLHEVAHAVDDKHKFMDSRSGQGKYGNWTEYKGSNGKIATAVGKKYGVGLNGEDLTALTAYALARIGGKAPVPPRSDEEKAKRPDVDAWRVAVGVKNGPWWKGSESKKREIDGIVYQEAYENWWVSYDLAARKQGIHGYQFRAPGEWFAELYAAYYSDKLKASHPIAPDLAKLEIPA